MQCKYAILIAVLATLIATIGTLFLVLILFKNYLKSKKSTNASTSASCPTIITGSWYVAPKDQIGDSKAVITIGKVVDADSGEYSTVTLEGNEYPMQGTILIQGVVSNIVTSSDFYAPAYFRFDNSDDTCALVCYCDYINTWMSVGNLGPEVSLMTYDSSTQEISFGYSGDACIFSPVDSDMIDVYQE